MSDLTELALKLKSGEYDGTDIMKAWIAVEELQAARESEGGEAVAEVVTSEFERLDSCNPDFVKDIDWLDHVNVDQFPDGTKLYAHSHKQQRGVPDGNLIVSADWLKRVRRDLDACQKVIWMALRGQCDPAYCEEAQARLREIDEVLTTPQSKGDCTPQPDKWIPCSERLPTEDDGDYVWPLIDDRLIADPVPWQNLAIVYNCTAWMTTGLARPAPPEQESE